MTRYSLTFGDGVEAEAVAACLDVLASERPHRTGRRRQPLTVETHLRAGLVEWRVELPRHLSRSFMRASMRLVPGLGWKRLKARAAPRLRYGVELRLDGRRRLLAVDQAAAVSAQLLALAGDLGKDELLVVQWQIGGPLHRRLVPPAQTKSPPTIWNLPDWGRPRETTEAVAAARKKQANHLLASVGRVGVYGVTRERSHQLVAAVVGCYQLLRVPGAGLRRRSLPSRVVLRRMTRAMVIRTDPPVYGTAAELAALIGWPIGNPPVQGVRYERAPKRPMDRRVFDSGEPDRRLLGASGFPADKRALISIGVADGLKHSHLLGPTGSGKSTILASLALAEIRAARGVVVVDVKGDLVPDIVDRIPERSRQNVVVLDPTDTAPVGFNPLASAGTAGVDSILHVLRTTWSSSWGPRMDDILSSGLRTLALSPGHTLAELPLLLTDRSFRRPLVERAMATDPLALGTFWPAFDAASDDLRAQMLAPVMNKLRALLVHPPLRAVLAQPEPRFDLGRVFTDSQALLVRLPKGEIGLEAAQLMSGLLLAHLWRLVLGRTRICPSERLPVLIILDEVQDTLRLPDLADALVQARGAGVGLVLAHQHLDQLDKATRSAVLANAGTRVLFRLDHDDAAVMARRSGGDLQPEQLAHLAAFEAYASIMTSDGPTDFGSLRTLPLPPVSGGRAAILRENRQRFGVSATETEARLRKQLAGNGRGAPTGLLGAARASEDLG